MSSRSGRLARVLYDGNTIAGLSRWNLSGYKVAFGSADCMGDTVQKFERVDSDDPGMVSFEGNYDPDDANGQTAINAIKATTTGMTNLYFYEVYDVTNDDFVFWRVASGGDIKIETFDAVDMPKNGMGRITFSGRVSGAAMERVS